MSTEIALPRWIRLLVIDDNANFLQSMMWHIAADPQIAAVNTASTAEQGLRLTQQLQPNVVLVDLRMPGMSGVELISLLRSQMPDLCIVAISVSHDEKLQNAAYQRGAHTFLPKEDLIEKLSPLLQELATTGCRSGQTIT